MLKYYIKTTEALKRLRADQDGVVSFEYIIVAVCIIGAVSAVFGIGAAGAIGVALHWRDHRYHHRFHCGHCYLIRPSGPEGGSGMCPPLF